MARWLTSTLIAYQVRAQAGRDPEPSLLIIDSQSVKTTEKRGSCCDFDGGKKVKGRKRFILVDTVGLLVDVLVTHAKVSEQAGARQLLEQAHDYGHERVQTVLADKGYAGAELKNYVAKQFGWLLERCGEPVSKQQHADFVVQKWRWIVERTFGWLNYVRRLAKDFELLPETSVAMIQLAMSRLMLKRLTVSRTAG